MASLQSFMTAINLAAEATQAAHQGVDEIQSGEISTGITHLLNVAGATAAAATTDTGVQQEAVAATQLALTIFPIFTNFISMFRHRTKPTVVASEVNQQQAPQITPAQPGQ